MARRGLGTDRLIQILGVMVLLLAGISLYAIGQGARFGPHQPSPGDRALVQVRERLGDRGEVRYLEIGKGRSACGYAGVAGQREAVAFVSRPHRILMSDDPLGREFADLKLRFCPGFNLPPPTARSGVASSPPQG